MKFKNLINTFFSYPKAIFRLIKKSFFKILFKFIAIFFEVKNLFFAAAYKLKQLTEVLKKSFFKTKERSKIGLIKTRAYFFYSCSFIGCFSATIIYKTWQTLLAIKTLILTKITTALEQLILILVSAKSFAIAVLYGSSYLIKKNVKKTGFILVFAYQSISFWFQEHFNSKKSFIAFSIINLIILLITPILIKQEMAGRENYENIETQEQTNSNFTSLIAAGLTITNLSIFKNKMIADGSFWFSFEKESECLDLLDKFKITGPCKIKQQEAPYVHPGVEDISVNYPVKLSFLKNYLGTFALFDIFEIETTLLNENLLPQISMFTAGQESFKIIPNLKYVSFFAKGAKAGILKTEIQRKNKNFLVKHPAIKFFAQGISFNTLGILIFLFFNLFLISLFWYPVLFGYSLLAARSAFIQIIFSIISLIAYCFSSKSLLLLGHLIFYNCFYFLALQLSFYARKNTQLSFASLNYGLLVLSLTNYFFWLWLSLKGLQLCFFG